MPITTGVERTPAIPAFTPSAHGAAAGPAGIPTRPIVAVAGPSSRGTILAAPASGSGVT
ncbi:hypothetical protein [Nocardia higoensis]|uniref:hypothetical protein n=1 Tax=Nocardia higoensis TaxID=228599 RepID=UPI001C3F282D|nr:hypothetical protein [Nocardia higoensis]